MMKNKIYNLDSYTFTANDKILFDANVWLYLFPPPCNPQNKKISAYSKYIGLIWKAGSSIYIDPIILSEYLNRYCRIQWEIQFSDVYNEYKKFRNSSDFTKVSKAAAAFAQRIYSICEKHSLCFKNIDIESVLSGFQEGQIDFNDGLIIEVCRKENLKLLTHDGDFSTGGIDVLTINKKLLQN